LGSDGATGEAIGEFCRDHHQNKRSTFYARRPPRPRADCGLFE
jgi:hypothetical protein